MQRVYGIGGPGGIVIVEIENDSPAAFVVAFIVSGARRSVAGTGSSIEIDGRPRARRSVARRPAGPSAPSRWRSRPSATGRGRCRPSATGAVGSEAAVLYPLSHRNRLRIAVATSGDEPGPVELARGRERAGRGQRLARAPRARDAGRAPGPEGAGGRRPRPFAGPARSRPGCRGDRPRSRTGATTTEAAWAWRGLSLVGPARAPGGATARTTRRPRAGSSCPSAARSSATSAGIELAPDLPEPWWGQDFEVHDAPTRSGRALVRGALARRPRRAALGRHRPRARTSCSARPASTRPGRPPNPPATPSSPRPDSPHP